MPAIVLITARILMVAGSRRDGALLSRAVDVLDRVEPVYLFGCAVAAVAVLARAFSEITSLTGRRQLRWLAWGTVLGVGPFAIGYALPWSLGAEPPIALQLTAVPLSVVPLTIASAIVRYRLRDIEVIIKRALDTSAFLAASALLYISMQQLVEFVFVNDTDRTIRLSRCSRRPWSCCWRSRSRRPCRTRWTGSSTAIGTITGARWSPSRDLNSDLDVVRLSQRLVSRIVETLVLDRMALMLADERLGDFRTIGDFGFVRPVPRLTRASTLVPRLDSGHTVALDDPIAAARFRRRGRVLARPGSTTSFRASSKARRSPCSRSGARTATSRSTARISGCSRLPGRWRPRRTDVSTASCTSRPRKSGGCVSSTKTSSSRSTMASWCSMPASRSCAGTERSSRRAESRGPTPSASAREIFDAPFVDALRAAREENPHGTTLFKVPLSGRRKAAGSDGEATRLLVNATVVPLQNSPGDAFTGTILLIEDITERIRLEEQLQISEKMASIGLLAAGVAHEVNTPLTGISSFTQMLLDGADPADPKTALLEKIEQTFRAAKIVNGLLTLSRPARPAASARTSTSTASSRMCSRCSSTSSRSERSVCGASWRPIPRSSRASSTSCSRCS